MVEFLGVGRAPIDVGKEAFKESKERQKAILESKKRCVKCIYHCGRREQISAVTCDYLKFTGHRRGCDAVNCTKFEAGKKRKRRSKKMVI